jgi:hypothetical protein
MPQLLKKIKHAMVSSECQLPVERQKKLQEVLKGSSDDGIIT